MTNAFRLRNGANGYTELYPMAASARRQPASIDARQAGLERRRAIAYKPIVTG
jgi:hypothetical protein